MSNLYFLQKYGKIRDKTRGIIPWEPWEHLVAYLRALRTYRFIILLKPKQIGCTWALDGDNLHMALFTPGANILTLSKGEDEASESLGYSRFFWTQLPDFLRMKMGKDQASIITFPEAHSTLRALPSTEDAGVGFGGATRVAMDEFEYHKFDRKNFSEILPPILEGGQLVIQSTTDPLKVNTLMKELYRAARRGDNNFYPIFFPYDVLPNRTEEWRENLKFTGLRSYEIQGRYPRTEDEALETLKTRKFYDQNVLNDMMDNLAPLLFHPLSDKYGDMVRIFKPFVVGHRYAAFCDPSDGKEDPHAISIEDFQSGEQVASSYGKVPADQCAMIFDDLVKEYRAFNSYELNARAGGIFSQKMNELDTPNRCHFVTADGKLNKTKYGWWTGGKLKKDMIWGLEEDVRLRKIKLNDPRFIDELMLFIQPEGEDPQAPSGVGDDCVMCLGGLSQIKKFVPSGSVKVSRGTYND